MLETFDKLIEGDCAIVIYVEFLKQLLHLINISFKGVFDFSSISYSLAVNVRLSVKSRPHSSDELLSGQPGRSTQVSRSTARGCHLRMNRLLQFYCKIVELLIIFSNLPFIFLGF